MSAAPTLRFITPADPLYSQEIDLRYRVLRAPLGRPRGSEIFPFENESLHLVAVIDDRVVGCVLFHPDPNGHDGASAAGSGGGRLFQMAVEESLRGLGLGRRLVRALERELASRGFTSVHLHARTIVAPFYRALGYVERGMPFEEIGIPHVEMWRALDADTEIEKAIDGHVDGAEDGK